MKPLQLVNDPKDYMDNLGMEYGTEKEMQY
jgi:hypothetical protein